MPEGVEVHDRSDLRKIGYEAATSERCEDIVDGPSGIHSLVDVGKDPHTWRNMLTEWYRSFANTPNEDRHGRFTPALATVMDWGWRPPKCRMKA